MCVVSKAKQTEGVREGTAMNKTKTRRVRYM